MVDLPPSKFSIAAQLSDQGNIISESLRIIGENKWDIPDGKWVVYSYTLYHHPGVDGGEVNYLDDRLMDTFIPIAHESYEKYFNDQMGKSVPGVFVDNEGDFGWQMAWSNFLAKRYEEMKKRDIRLWLPLLTEKDEEGLWAKARYDWFDVVSDVYSKQYLGRLSDWLEERQMYCISNLWEEDLMLQTRAVGDFMRAQRHVTMPGNDCLQMKSQQVHDFKETQSVCAFEDKPFMRSIAEASLCIQSKSNINSRVVTYCVVFKKYNIKILNSTDKLLLYFCSHPSIVMVVLFFNRLINKFTVHTQTRHVNVRKPWMGKIKK